MTTKKLLIVSDHATWDRTMPRAAARHRSPAAPHGENPHVELVQAVLPSQGEFAERAVGSGDEPSG